MSDDLVQRARAIERRIGDIAGRQHGLVTRAQLIGAGLSVGAVRWRVRSGRLEPVQRGVYSIGPAVHPRGREMAAVLACGPGAVISHRSAAVLWGLCRPGDGAVEVTVPNGRQRLRPAVRAHRVPCLPTDEVTEREGIPITVPSRTLLDLSCDADPREAERAVARAFRAQLARHDAMLELMGRYPRRRGARVLRAILEGETDPALVRSEAEERFLDLVRRARLPHPEVNAVVAGFEVDFLWRAERTVAEVDGFEFHASRARFEGDRQRDATLAAKGFQVIRVTWRQLTGEPEASLARLAQALVVRAARAAASD